MSEPTANFPRMTRSIIPNSTRNNTRGRRSETEGLEGFGARELPKAKLTRIQTNTPRKRRLPKALRVVSNTDVSVMRSVTRREDLVSGLPYDGLERKVWNLEHRVHTVR